jgi:HEAT repeat protein
VSDPQAIQQAIKQHIVTLASHDVLARDRARQQLVEIGPPALEALLGALTSTSESVRWEAARAIGQIRHPAAVEALIKSLEDPTFAVRWLAAQGLIEIGLPSAGPLLRALLAEDWDNIWLRQGAHHVLRSMLSGSVGTVLAPVVAALEGPEPAVTVPIAAYRALGELPAP